MYYSHYVALDSVYSIATRYGLDSPGIDSWQEARFSAPVQMALGPTQPPILPSLFPRGKAAGAWR
jgi:hypothetical protein